MKYVWFNECDILVIGRPMMNNILSWAHYQILFLRKFSEKKIFFPYFFMDYPPVNDSIVLT